jgi:hypothetical protein
MRFTKWVLPSALGTLICAGGLASAQQPVPYQGLEHSSLGGAQVNKDPATGELFISNIGASGQDGVAVALPRVPTHTSTWTDYNVNDPGLSGRVESTIDSVAGPSRMGPSLDLAGAPGNVIELSGFNGHTIGTGARLTTFLDGVPTATFDLGPSDVIQFSADTSVSTGGQDPIDSIVSAFIYEPDAIGIRFGDGENGRLGVSGSTARSADADAIELRVLGMDLPPDAGLSEIRFFPGETTSTTQPLLIIAECIEGEALAATGLGNVVLQDLNANGAPTDGACPSCRLTLSNIGASGDDGALLESSASYVAARGRPAYGGAYTFAARPGSTGGLEVPVGGTFAITYLVRTAGISAPGPVAPSQEIVFDNAPGARAIRLVDRQPFGGGLSGSAGSTTLELLRSGAVVQTHQVGLTNLSLDLLGGDDRIEISHSIFDSNRAIGGAGGADETTQHTFVLPVTVSFDGSPAVEIDSMRIQREWTSGQLFSYEGAIVRGANLPDGVTLDTGASGPAPTPAGGIPASSLREAILTASAEGPLGTGDNVGVLLRGFKKEEIERGGGARFDLGSASGAGAAVRGLVGARARLVLLDEPAASEPILSFELDPTANGDQGGGILNVGGDLVVDRVLFTKGSGGEVTDEVVIESPVFPLDLGVIPMGTPELPDFDFSFKTLDDPSGGPSRGASAWFYWDLERPTALPGGTLTLADELALEIVVATQSPSSFDRYASLETSFLPDGRNPQTGEPVEIKGKLLAREATHTAQGGGLMTATSPADSVVIRNVGPSGRDGVELDLANSPAVMGAPGRSIRSAEIDLALPSSGVPFDPLPGAVGSTIRVEWTGRTTAPQGFGTFSVKKREARAEISLDDLAETPPEVTVTVLDDGLPVGSYTVTELPPYTVILESGTLISSPPEFWSWSFGSSMKPLPQSAGDEITMTLRLPIDFVVNAPDGASQLPGDELRFTYETADRQVIESARVLGVNLGELRVDDVTIAPGPSGVLYASDLNTDQLFTVDPATAATAVVGPFGSVDVTGMAYDAESDTLFAASVGSGELLVVDRTTGAGTAVGPIGFDVTGVTWDPTTDTLFAVDFVANVLLTIDPATGAGTSVGSLGYDLVAGLAFDPNTEALYGVDLGTDELLTIDTATGAATAVGALGFINVASLALDPVTGTLYAVDFTTNELLTIDPTTGAGRVIAGFSGPTLEGVRGMAFVPEPSIVLSLAAGSSALALLGRRGRARHPRRPAGA